jgi:hypothetical protein
MGKRKIYVNSALALRRSEYSHKGWGRTRLFEHEPHVEGEEGKDLCASKGDKYPHTFP